MSFCILQSHCILAYHEASLSDFYIFDSVSYFVYMYVIRIEYRYLKTMLTQVEENPAIRIYGIPQHSGIFYAMALALIMEGLMSG